MNPRDVYHASVAATSREGDNRDGAQNRASHVAKSGARVSARRSGPAGRTRGDQSRGRRLVAAQLRELERRLAVVSVASRSASSSIADRASRPRAARWRNAAPFARDSAVASGDRTLKDPAPRERGSDRARPTAMAEKMSWRAPRSSEQRDNVHRDTLAGLCNESHPANDAETSSSAVSFGVRAGIEQHADHLEIAARRGRVERASRCAATRARERARDPHAAVRGQRRHRR